MPQIKIADVVQHNLITHTDILETGEKMKFVSSGVIGSDPAIDSAISGMARSTTIDIDYHVEPEFVEPEYMDDSDTDATLHGISELGMTGVLAYMSHTFSQATFVKLVQYSNSMEDGLTALVNYISRYWDLNTQHRAFALIQGALSSNKANEGGDLVEVLAAPFSYGAAVDAMAKRGDNIQETFDHFFCNTQVYQNLLKRQEITFIQDADTGATLTNWNNMTLQVDDILAPVGGKSTSFFVRGAAFVKSDVNLDMIGSVDSIEENREPLKGRGGGRTDIITRSANLMHLAGYTYNKATQAGISPTLAELQQAGNWTRINKAKQSTWVAVESVE